MIKTIDESNDILINLINSGKVFSISRLGHIEGLLTIQYILYNKVNENLSLRNAGIYSKKNDMDIIKLWCKKYHEAIINSDYLASFMSLCVDSQNFYKNNFNIKQIHSRSIEPFYVLMENKIPWTHYLIDKKILVISPFVESFKKQMNNGFRIFKDKNIFLENQKFVFYKSYQTLADNHIHEDWLETFNIMCDDISHIDFDIALLSCGGYGLPLCDYIKKKLNKSSIYVGGGLQLLFGVMGERWRNNKIWNEIIEQNNCKFISPSGDEICKNCESIENNCYW